MYKYMSKKQDIIEITNILDVVNYMEGMEVLLFDMDDTLYSEKEYVRSGYLEVAKILPDVKYAEEKLWHLFCEGKKAIDEYLRQENIFTQELKEKCLNIYRFNKPNIHLYAGVKEMLEELKENYGLGLITDGRPEGQRLKIEALGLQELFDEIIITDELGSSKCRKPNPMAFRRMANKFNQEYSRMCYIGDNINKDFIAPQMLGMKCIWFKNSEGLYYK